MSLVLIILIILTPYRVSFSSHDDENWTNAYLAVDLIYLTDIVVIHSYTINSSLFMINLINLQLLLLNDKISINKYHKFFDNFLLYLLNVD